MVAFFLHIDIEPLFSQTSHLSTDQRHPDDRRYDQSKLINLKIKKTYANSHLTHSPNYFMADYGTLFFVTRGILSDLDE